MHGSGLDLALVFLLAAVIAVPVATRRVVRVKTDT